MTSGGRGLPGSFGTHADHKRTCHRLQQFSRTSFDRFSNSDGLYDAGQPLMRIFAKPAAAEKARQTLLEAVRIADERPGLGPLVLDRIS